MMDYYRHFPKGVARFRNAKLGIVYFLAAVFTFQSLFLAYSNSSYLEIFIPTSTIGLLYSVAAAGSLLLFFIIPVLLSRFGNYTTTIVSMIVITVCTFLLGIATSIPLIIFTFVLYLALTPLLYLNIDIFTETFIGTNETNTGTSRGILLVIMSIAAFIAPWLMGIIAGENGNLRSLYFIATGIGLFFIILTILSLKNFSDEPYQKISVKRIWQHLITNKDVRCVTYNHFLLQLFFTWAVVYIPLYLVTEIGFNWNEIGIIIAIGATAYTIFELPIGWIADNKIGEKEMMILGFIVLVASVIAIGSIHNASLLLWAIVMFISRIGCSFIEVTTESYFFKNTTGKDADIISLFRMTRPAANLTGALIGSISLLLLPFSNIFFVLALILFSGIFISFVISDTR
jgi:MFS family permease